jgi:hypothetical protein
MVLLTVHFQGLYRAWKSNFTERGDARMKLSDLPPGNQPHASAEQLAYVMAHMTCGRCHREKEDDGRRTCEECREYARERARERNEERKAGDLCLRCNNAPVRGRTMCRDHLRYASKREAILATERNLGELCLRCDRPSAKALGIAASPLCRPHTAQEADRWAELARLCSVAERDLRALR